MKIKNNDKICNLCGFNKFKILFKSKNYPDPRGGILVRCIKCGLIFRSSTENYNFDYPDSPSELKPSIYAEYLKIISPYREKNRLLEVGPGYGYFMYLCKKEGWETWGIEKRLDLVEYAKNKYKIDIIHGLFEDFDSPDNYFDAVLLFNVLDHLPDPTSALGKVFRVLRHGGIILIRTPNASFHVNYQKMIRYFYHFSKFLRKLDISTVHLYSFSRKNIKDYLKKTGFSDIFFWNSPISKLINSNPIINLEKYLRAFLELLRILTHGRLIIGPSISIRAMKPIYF